MIRLTSLLLVEERLLEASYFARQLGKQAVPARIQYHLNAFLSAARSTTFLLQKEMSKVPGFEVWWQGKRTELAQDRAATFFLKLRNFSQKEGRIALVGSARKSGNARRWTHRFIYNDGPVPEELLNRDVAECCLEHVAKLARLVLECMDTFPYHTCPRRALTPQGVATLRLDPNDIEEAMGLPRGWTSVGGNPLDAEQLRVLASQLDGVDVLTLKRLAAYRARARESGGPDETLAGELLRSFVQLTQERQTSRASRAAIVATMMQRLSKPRSQR